MPRCESASTALAQLRAALAMPGNMLLAKARENMVVQRQQRFTPRSPMPPPLAAATSKKPSPVITTPKPSPTMTPPSATAWGCTAVARQHARNKQRETALESYSQQMARRAGTQPANVTMSPIPALLSQKATAPYRAPQPSVEVKHVPGPETQLVMEEMEEEDLQ